MGVYEINVRLVVTYAGPEQVINAPPSVRIYSSYIDVDTGTLNEYIDRAFPIGEFSLGSAIWGFPLITMTYELKFLFQPFNIIHGVTIFAPYANMVVESGFIEVNQISGGSVTANLPI